MVDRSILYEDVWSAWLSKIDQSRYGLYVHPKHEGEFDTNISSIKITNKWTRTGWGSRSLTIASLFVMEEAVNDGCDYLILLSGDSVPMRSFDDILGAVDNNIFCCPVEPLGSKELWRFKKVMRFRWNGGSDMLKAKIKFDQFKKQNMFFGMSTECFKQIHQPGSSADASLSKYFPKKPAGTCRITDEHYFINACEYLDIPYVNIPNWIVCSHKRIPGDGEARDKIVDNKTHPRMHYKLDYRPDEKVYTQQQKAMDHGKGLHYLAPKYIVPTNTYFIRKAFDITDAAKKQLIK